MRNVQNLEEEKFYLTDSNQFDRIYNIISRMPNYILYKTSEQEYTDYYYDTEDKFLEVNRESVRVRKFEDKQILSIKYVSSNALKEEKVREGYLEMPVDADVTTYREALLFLSTKINDIYARSLEIDLVRKMRDLKVYLVVYTQRTCNEVKNNEELKIFVNFDRCDYESKFSKGHDNIVKIILQNYPDKLNMVQFQNFINEINKKVYFINDNESKFESAKRILNYDRFNKKVKDLDGEDEDEENEDDSDEE